MGSEGEEEEEEDISTGGPSPGQRCLNASKLSQSTPGLGARHTVTTDHGHTSEVTSGVSLNMDGDKNGGHNGPGPGPTKPDPQEANNSYTTQGALKWCPEERFE